MRLLTYMVCLLPTVLLAQELESGVPAGIRVADDVLVGGWFDLLYSDPQGANSETTAPHAFIYADMGLSPRWRAFVEFASEDSTIEDRTSSIQRAYFEFKVSSKMKWRFGQFNTPSGLWKEKHWHIMVDANRKPVMADLKYIPMHALGVELSGNHMTGPSYLDYSVFVAQSDDQDRDDKLSYGMDFSAEFTDRIRVGAFHYQYMNAPESSDPIAGERRTWLAYLETDIVPSALQFRAEYIHVEREQQKTANGYYAKLKWQVHKQIYLNYRFDDTDDTQTGMPLDRTGHTITLGYHPLDRIRMRVEWSHQSIDSSSQNEWSAWLGFIL